MIPLVFPFSRSHLELLVLYNLLVIYNKISYLTHEDIKTYIFMYAFSWFMYVFLGLQLVKGKFEVMLAILDIEIISSIFTIQTFLLEHRVWKVGLQN